MSKNIVCALRFQQLLGNKHDRLRDAKFGRVAIGSCNVGDKKKQEDLLDLITALLKFKSSLSTTVAAQCRFQSSP